MFVSSDRGIPILTWCTWVAQFVSLIIQVGDYVLHQLLVVFKVKNDMEQTMLGNLDNIIKTPNYNSVLLTHR